MGKKYIVELGRCERLYKALIDGNGKPELNWLAPVVDIPSYTEPDAEQIRKEAYEEGYKDGLQFSIDDARLKEEYKQGLNDAWDAARKIAHCFLWGSYKKETGSLNACAQDVLEYYSASEAIEKIRQYEQYEQEQEIKIGDEVDYYGAADEYGNVYYSGVVLKIRKDDYLIMEKDGKTYQLKKKLIMSKTGRHFPEIVAVLEKMQGEQE